jgi:uncharacterized DUF497 family protein
VSRDPLAECIGFEWDEWNSGKNWEKHRVTPEEAEDVFFHDPFVMMSDRVHSAREKRYAVLGQTGAARKLFVIFTIRRRLIRVISVRDMNRRESEEYSKHEKTDS